MLPRRLLRRADALGVLPTDPVMGASVSFDPEGRRRGHLVRTLRALPKVEAACVPRGGGGDGSTGNAMSFRGTCNNSRCRRGDTRTGCAVCMAAAIQGTTTLCKFSRSRVEKQAPACHARTQPEWWGHGYMCPLW